MICVLVIGTVMLLAAVGIGYTPLKRGAHIVGSCSAAMSAACHPPVDQNTDREVMTREKLSLDVVSMSSFKCGRCAFSNGVVKPLLARREYVG